MKRTAIKIKNYAGNVNIVNNNNLGKRIFHILSFALGTLALLYVLILGNMIFNVVARQGLDVHARALSNEVGDLELQYLSMSSKIDLALSSEMGFKEGKTQFAVRKPIGALSITSNEL